MKKNESRIKILSILPLSHLFPVYPGMHPSGHAPVT